MKDRGAPPLPVSPPPTPGTPRHLGAALAALLVFVVVSRLPEVMANVIGTSFKIALLLTAICGIICVASGRFPDTLRRAGAITILLFTVWWVICIPFSFWPGGSANLLRHTWSFSLFAFLIVATIPASSRDLKFYGGAMAWSAVFVNLVILKYGGEVDSRSTVQVSSSLANPNIAALQLLLGLPFLLYWTRTMGFLSIRGLIGFFSAGLLAVLIVTRTGSRSGLLILGLLLLLLLSGTKLVVRVGLIFAIAAGIAVVIPFVPNYLLYRYGTLFSRDADDRSEAVASSLERQALLRESIVLTFEHPVFGIGAGQFQAATAKLSQLQGVRAAWLETHNMYTQISSETGVPGVLIYLTMILVSLVPVWQDMRFSRRFGILMPRHEFARALLISSFGLLINSAFTSVAYQYYWPIMCSMGLAYQRVAALERAAPALAAPVPVRVTPGIGRAQPARIQAR